MIIWLNKTHQQWVHSLPSSVLKPDWSAAVLVFKCITGVSFVGEVSLWQGSVYGRRRADWFDLCFSVSLQHWMFIPFSVTDSGMCIYMCVCVVCVCLFFMLSRTKHWPWPRQTEVDRLYSTICHRPGKGEKNRSEETEGCILIVSYWEKRFDKNKWDSLSLGADMKRWAVSLVLFFLIKKSFS